MERLLTTMPSFSSSPRMRSLPQSGFSGEIGRSASSPRHSGEAGPAWCVTSRSNRGASPGGASGGPSPAGPGEGAAASHRARPRTAIPTGRDLEAGVEDAGWSVTQPEADVEAPGSPAATRAASLGQLGDYER